MKLLFKGHFLINAADKVGAGHSVQKRKVFIPGNFFLSSLPPSLPLSLPGTPQDINCFDSVSIIGWVKSSEHIYLFGLGLSKLFPNLILGPLTIIIIMSKT